MLESQMTRLHGFHVACYWLKEKETVSSLWELIFVVYFCWALSQEFLAKYLHVRYSFRLRPFQARIQGRWNGWIFTPVFLNPLLSFFSYPSNIDLKHVNQALVLLHYYKNSPPISKSWIRVWASMFAYRVNIKGHKFLQGRYKTATLAVHGARSRNYFHLLI